VSARPGSRGQTETQNRSSLPFRLHSTRFSEAMKWRTAGFLGRLEETSRNSDLLPARAIECAPNSNHAGFRSVRRSSSLRPKTAFALHKISKPFPITVPARQRRATRRADGASSWPSGKRRRPAPERAPRRRPSKTSHRPLTAKRLRVSSVASLSRGPPHQTGAPRRPSKTSHRPLTAKRLTGSSSDRRAVRAQARRVDSLSFRAALHFRRLRVLRRHLPSLSCTTTPERRVRLRRADGRGHLCWPFGSKGEMCRNRGPLYAYGFGSHRLP
jgi:hypothetical protein